MKKILSILSFCIIVVGLVYASTTNVIYNVASYIIDETEPYSEVPDSNWYYKRLNETEADIYKRIATAVKNIDKKIIILSKSKVGFDVIDRAFEAFMLDNADVFYLDNLFSVNELNLYNAYKYEITLTYISDNKQQIYNADQKLEQEIKRIREEIITEGMNDFEKEVAIHDYLVSTIKYYEYKNIQDIPYDKHHIYSALVEKEAVCDGFSKAFQEILQREGIETITVTGKTDEIAHAWNKVKIDNNWYNVDVTSDTITENNKKMVTHEYFNLDDSTLSLTHKINNDFNIPESNSTEYNYYNYLGLYIDNYTNLKYKLREVINKNNSSILEFKDKYNSYDKQEVINALYDLNFNNYKKNNIQSIEYYYQNGTYMFVKY